MPELAGPFAVATLVLAGAGLAKLANPLPTNLALAAVGGPGKGARLIGGVEVLVALVALFTAHPVAVAGVGVLYASFVVFLWLAARADVASCGCFGSAATPPSWIHVVFDLAAAGVAAAMLATGGPSIVDVVRDQPWGGVPFIASVLAMTWLMFVTLTILPQVRQRARRMTDWIEAAT